MRDGRTPGHHISVEIVARFARKLEHARGAAQQGIEPLARVVAGERRPVMVARKRQHDLKVPAKLECGLCGDLIRAIGDRRYQLAPRRCLGEAVGGAGEQGRARCLDFG